MNWGEATTQVDVVIAQRECLPVQLLYSIAPLIFTPIVAGEAV